MTENVKTKDWLSFDRCADCGGPLVDEKGTEPCELEDGRTVCSKCCVADLLRIVKAMREGAQ